MGLTIHWDLRMEGEANQVVEKLERIRQKFVAACSRLPQKFASKVAVSPVEFWDEKKVRKEEEAFKRKAPSDDKWFYIISQRWIDAEDLEGNRIVSTSEAPRRLAFFFADIMDGCETLIIMLGEFEDGIWENSNFCKTTYAESPVAAHLIVTRCLEICEAEGILVDVVDEGDFWQNRRDPKAVEKLVEAFKQDHAMLASFAGMLHSIAKEKDVKVEAAIDKFFVREAVNEALKDKEL